MLSYCCLVKILAPSLNILLATGLPRSAFISMRPVHFVTIKQFIWTFAQFMPGLCRKEKQIHNMRSNKKTKLLWGEIWCVLHTGLMPCSHDNQITDHLHDNISSEYGVVTNFQTESSNATLVICHHRAVLALSRESLQTICDPEQIVHTLTPNCW